MPLSGDCRRTIICRELIAGNLDNIIAILILSKNTSGVKNFLHNTLLFQLNSAMLQYSLDETQQPYGCVESTTT